MNRRKFLATTAAAGLASSSAAAADEVSRQYFELTFFRLKNSAARQRARMLEFLEEHHLPMSKRVGLGPVGYFQVYLGADTPKIVMLTAHDSLADLEAKVARKYADKKWTAAADQWGGSADAPFERVERWLLRAFEGMPRIEVPEIVEGKAPRLFDLRTYESESFADNREKANMFNTEEIRIFRESGVQPVFFGQAMFGSKLPNLTYMVCYDDMRAREKAWRTFSAHPDWNRIKVKPGWSNEEIVSAISNTFLRPLPFSPIR